MKKDGKKQKHYLWRGLTTTTASVLALSLSATLVIDSFRSDIDRLTGSASTQMVTDNQSEDDYKYKSDYSTTTELLDSIEDLGERMSEEGTVLLKNNGALPLSEEETKKISLLGFSSYFPIQGGDMGSSLNENKGTDAIVRCGICSFFDDGYLCAVPAGCRSSNHPVTVRTHRSTPL